jgi:hypothetical protein
MKKIGYATSGFLGLPHETQLKAVIEFERVSGEKDDWLYTLMDNKIFAQENEEGSYTIMLAEEY